MGGCQILLEGPRFIFEVLLGPGEQTNLQNVWDVPLRVQFHSCWNKKEWGSPGCDHRCPHHHRLQILVSGDNSSFSCGSGCPNSIIFLVNSLLDVEFLLVSENQIGQRAFCDVLQKFPAFFGPHGHLTI